MNVVPRPQNKENRPALALVHDAVDVGAWFDAHAAFVARSIQRLTGLSSAVDDLVQEVFLIALAKHDALGPEVDPRGWLYRTAQYLVMHQRRSIARRLRAEQGLVFEPRREVSRVDIKLEQLEQAQAVRDCVRSLPLKQREVFSLFELEGLAGDEVARILGIPENTVWSRLRVGRERFRQLWEKREQKRRQP